MSNFLRITVFASLCALVISSCKKEKTEEEENENELITTVQVKLTEQGTSNTETYSWVDIDGAGGIAPEIDDILLKPNTVYNAEVSFLDESQSPAENITTEIEEEGDVHRLYFISTAGAVTVTDLNNDADGLPLGLTSKWTTTTAVNGTIKISLRHYPNGGKENSDPVNSSKSSTDAEVDFNVIVGAP